MAIIIGIIVLLIVHSSANIKLIGIVANIAGFVKINLFGLKLQCVKRLKGLKRLKRYV